MAQNLNVKYLVDSFCQFSDSVLAAAKQIRRLYEAIIHCYSNKRVVYLALNAKKERVRKKNLHRIIKYARRSS